MFLGARQKKEKLLKHANILYDDELNQIIYVNNNLVVFCYKHGAVDVVEANHSKEILSI